MIFPIFGLKPWIRIGIQPKLLDPDPDQNNTDPKHWQTEASMYPSPYLQAVEDVEPEGVMLVDRIRAAVPPPVRSLLPAPEAAVVHKGENVPLVGRIELEVGVLVQLARCTQLIWQTGH